MALIVLQPHGLGDHIFCQSLIHQIADRQDIVWPVLPHFIKGLKKAYPEVNWIPNGVLGQIENHKRDSIINGNRIIPIRWADQILRVKYENCMRAKYDMYSIDWQSWRLCDYQRDQEKENELFYNVLGLVDFSEPFRLINQTFTSLENNKVEIPESKEIRNVYMKNIPGFSLFDWSKVIEKATEIHTVSTSINYVIEMLEIKAKAVDLYVRKPQEKDFRNIQYILQRHNYNFHL
jgi:hypothetical protein